MAKNLTKIREISCEIFKQFAIDKSRNCDPELIDYEELANSAITAASEYSDAFDKFEKKEYYESKDEEPEDFISDIDEQDDEEEQDEQDEEDDEEDDEQIAKQINKLTFDEQIAKQINKLTFELDNVSLSENTRRYKQMELEILHEYCECFDNAIIDEKSLIYQIAKLESKFAKEDLGTEKSEEIKLQINELKEKLISLRLKEIDLKEKKKKAEDVQRAQKDREYSQQAHDEGDKQGYENADDDEKDEQLDEKQVKISDFDYSVENQIADLTLQLNDKSLTQKEREFKQKQITKLDEYFNIKLPEEKDEQRDNEQHDQVEQPLSETEIIISKINELEEQLAYAKTYVEKADIIKWIDIEKEKLSAYAINMGDNLKLEWKTVNQKNDEQRNQLKEGDASEKLIHFDIRVSEKIDELRKEIKDPEISKRNYKYKSMQILYLQKYFNCNANDCDDYTEDMEHKDLALLFEAEDKSKIRTEHIPEVKSKSFFGKYKK